MLRETEAHMADKITPFDPNIPQDEVNRLFRKLADTRLPQTPVVPDAGEDYGNRLASPLLMLLII